MALLKAYPMSKFAFFNLLIPFTLSIFISGSIVFAQQTAHKGSCPLFDVKGIELNIPGSVDTVQENGIKVRAIDPSILVKGFDLVSTDTSVVIEKFRLTFDHPDGNLYSKASVGNKILASQGQDSFLQKIGLSKLITIDDIHIRYKGACYRVRGQVYLKR